MVAFNLQFHSNIPGRPFPVWRPPGAVLSRLALLDRLLPDLDLLPLLVPVGHPLLNQWWAKRALGQLGQVGILSFIFIINPGHFYTPAGIQTSAVQCTLRSWRVWKLNAAYYPVTLVKTADLDPKKNHLVSCHPHGILCFGATV